MAETTEFGTEISVKQPSKGRFVTTSDGWSTLISSALDVTTILSYMSSAERGYLRYQMEMFDRMVERDPHLGAVLQTRRLALTQAEWDVVPGDEEDARAVEAADMVRDELMGLPNFEDNVQGLLDAVGKGISVAEIVWAPDWGLADLVEVPGKLLDWQNTDLRVYADGIHAVPMIPNKFVIHSPRTRPGQAVRRGLMRTLAIYWCIAHYAMEDWASFSEVFGVPLRLGKYPANSKEADISILYDALKNLGSDAAGVIPADMMIEFPEPNVAKMPGGTTPMQTLIEYIERKMSIAVLGQNLTTESQSGTGTLAGGAHERVRRDLVRADARQLGSTFRRDLFRPLVGFRMGWDVPLPYLVWDLEDPTDQKMRSEVLKNLNSIGVPISMAQIREEFQLAEPADDEDTLAPSQGRGPDVGMFTTARLAAVASSKSEPLGSAQRANGRLAADAASDGQSDIARLLDLVERLSESAGSPDEVLTRLRLAAPDLEDVVADAGISMDDFEDLAARALVTADLNGRVAVRAEREV